MLLGVTPHLVEWAATGDPSYLPDRDGLLYHAWARAIVLDDGVWMTDAVHPQSGPMMHPWELFVPEAWLARALGVRTVGLGVIWRLLGGGGIAAALYAVVRPYVKTPAAAAVLAAFLLFDAGLIHGQIVRTEVQTAVSCLRGSTEYFQGVPHLIAHLRVPTPALAIPFLLLHFALMLRARRLGTTRSAIEAGVSLGLLFHVFFYFASAAGVAIVMSWIVDKQARRTYTVALLVGGIIAAPAVIVGKLIQSSTPSDWLRRTDKFVAVDRFDPARLLAPKVLIVEWLILAWPVFRYRRDLTYLWLFTLGGLILTNQHVVTGFDLENFHWSMAWGLAFSMLCVLLALPWVERVATGRVAIVAIVVVAQVALGMTFRTLETRKSSETIWLRTMLDDWRAEGIDLPSRAVVAGPRDLLLLLGATQVIFPVECRLVEYSSKATDLERDERAALNTVLQGYTGEAAERVVELGENVFEASRARRLRLLGEISTDAGPLIETYGVTHVLAESGVTPKGVPARFRLRRVAQGRTMDLWRIDPRPLGPARGSADESSK